MLFVFAETSTLPDWMQKILDLWPVWSVIAAIVAGVFAWRSFEKAGIHKTNAANITALEGLIDTRDKEIAELTAENSELTAAKDVLESEYKALAGVVLSDLLVWVADYTKHKAELLQKESEIRILKTRIEIMEDREAESAEIHKSR